MSQAYLLLVAAMLFYAGNLVVGKPVVAAIPPITLTLLRYIIAFLAVFPLGYREWRANKNLWKKEWKAIVALSISGLVLFNILVYLSLQSTTSINAAIVESSTPVFALLLGFFLFKERFSKLQLIGVAISLFGVLLVITRGSLEVITSLSFNPGDLTMLIAMLTWSIYSILIKQHTWKFPTYGGLLVMSFVAIILLLPFSLLELREVVQIEWSFQLTAGLIYLGVFPSLVALIAYNKGVAAIGPSRASIFLNLIPLFAMAGGLFFLGEKLTLLQLSGAFLVITGVIFANKQKGKAKDIDKQKSA